MLNEDYIENTERMIVIIVFKYTELYINIYKP